MTGILDTVASLWWALVYALPWAAAFLVGRWSWYRLRPLSALLAWAAATCIALAALLIGTMVMVEVIEALTLG